MTAPFDRVYIVHYKPLVERKRNILQCLQRANITNYEFVEEYDRDSTPVALKEVYYKGAVLNDPQICITITHFEIYKRILANGYNRSLILEDDAILCDNFPSLLQTYCNQLPNDFEIGFLNDGCNLHIPSEQIRPKQVWYKKQATRTCCSYLITRQCCEKLLRVGVPFHEPIDFELNRLLVQHSIGSYWCEPTIVTDGSGKIYATSYARAEDKTDANEKHKGEQPKDLVTFTKKIQTNEPFVFAKFGDGEYNAAIHHQGANCDGTPYTNKLGQSVREAIQDLTQSQSHSQSSNVFIGRWQETKGVDQYFQSLTTTPIQWLNYNNFIFKSRYEFMNTHFGFYKAIRYATQQKIYVCNQSMIDRSNQLLNINNHICIDPVNWFDTSYYTVLGNVISSVQKPTECIILVSAGMGAKKLIADLHKVLPSATIIDLGSALDLMCGGRRSRDFHNIPERELMEMCYALFT
jgi:GR25 family glycosyltransferase involved in LPS biosynthesis